MKRYTRITAVTLVLSLGFLTQPAQAATVDDLERKIEQMQKSHERQISELKKEINALKRAQAKAGILQEDTEKPFPAQLAQAGEGHPIGGTRGESSLRRFGRNTYVGGYFDMEYEDTEDAGRTFDQHRVVPFIYADISDKIKFATEIEFEHGATDNNQSDGSVKVEFAALDYLIKDWLNLRTGILLSPLGKLNLVHDSPIQDLTARPLVSTNVIPTTLSEAGAGIFGSFYPTENSKVDYELYAVNGFDGGGNTGSAISSNINVNKGIREARGSQKSDNNDNLAVVSRVSVSPFLGAEIGGSVHHGAYSDDGQLDLSVFALDWAFQKGPFELLGEYAQAEIERNAEIITFNQTLSNTATGRIPGDLDGYYVQGNYHFMPPFLQRWFPDHFTEESTFTLVTRWEEIDLAGDDPSLVGDRERLTLGLNFRPIEDTVLKLDYQINDGGQAADDRNRFFASVASYF